MTHDAQTQTTRPTVHDIRDFGAIGDGRTFCTEAFARAIENCVRAGGGVVYCPSGDYVTKTITLKDHVELHLDRGARLLSAIEPVPEPGVSGEAQTTNRKAYLIGAVGVTNAAITGHGTIDGRAALHFWQHKEEPGEQTGRIDNVLMHHVVAQAKRGCYISGHAENPIGSITLDNFKLILSGPMGPVMVNRVPDPYPLWFNDLDRDGIPFGIFARWVDRLTVSNSEMEWRDATGHWSSAIRCESVRELSAEGLRIVDCPVPERQAIVRLGEPASE